MKPLRALLFTDFVREVLRARYTLGQIVFAKVAFDGVDPCALEGREREIALQMFGGAETVPPVARRTIVAYLGRNSGKTTIVADYGIYRLITADLSTAGPGDIPSFSVAAPTMKVARIMLRKALARVKATPVLASMVIAETSLDFTVRRHDGRIVEFEVIAMSRGGATGRGKDWVGAAGDESDVLYTDSYIRSDTEWYRGIKPRLHRDGSVLLISTPWGDESLMRKLFSENFGCPQTALCALAPTLLMRDNDPNVREIVEAEMASDLENAKREFECDMSGTVGASRLLAPETIDAAVDDALVLPAAGDGCSRFGAGWDLATIRDSAVQVIAGGKGSTFRTLSITELQHRGWRGCTLGPSTSDATAKQSGGAAAPPDAPVPGGRIRLVVRWAGIGGEPVLSASQAFDERLVGRDGDGAAASPVQVEDDAGGLAEFLGQIILGSEGVGLVHGLNHPPTTSVA